MLVENDVWKSFDGMVWEQVVLSSNFGNWDNGQALAFADLFYLIGGWHDGVTPVDEVWVSASGPVALGPVQHSQLGSPDLHEPKGISAAAIDTVFVADGAGTGNWIAHPKASTIPDGGGAGIPAAVTLTAPTAYTPCTISVSGNDTNVGFTAADGPKVTYTGSRAAVVEAHYSLTVFQTDAGAQDVYVTWSKNGVTQPQYEVLVNLAQNIEHNFKSTIMLEMDTNDYLEVQLKVAAGNLTINNAYVSCVSMPTKEV